MTNLVPGVRIAGQSRDGSHPDALEVTDPTTGRAAFHVAIGGSQDAADALASSVDALPGWASVPVGERAQRLRDIARHLRRAAEDGDIARLTTAETGKRIVEARAEVRFSADYFDFYADLISTTSATSWDVVPGVRHTVRSRPKGVVAVLTPWNFPISVPARKIAPAIAAGCTVVFKPSELTPVSSLRFAEIVDEYVPPGVVNTVTGYPDDVSQPWLGDLRVRVVTFTGSPRVGRILGRACGERLQDVLLELGGRAPFIVGPDADVDQAVELALIAKYRNNGQSCIAANNFWIHEAVRSRFVEAFLDHSMAMRVGDPLEEHTGLGPVRQGSALARLRDLIDASASESVKSASVDPQLTGWFLPPTVCLQPTLASKLWRDEQFGPVAAVRSYRDIDQVVRDVNDSEYALGGYVCSADTEWATNLVSRLDIEIVGVNVATPNIPHVPFGGSKSSGLGGYEGSLLGLDAFRHHQATAVAPLAGHDPATGEEPAHG